VLVGVGVAVAVGLLVALVVRVGLGDAVVGDAVADDEVGEAVGVAEVELVGLGLGVFVGLPGLSGRLARRRPLGRRRFLSAATAVEQPVRPMTPTTPRAVRLVTGGLSM
jgi:hypothetical protein